MSEEVKVDVMPRKRVDFSPWTYRKLLRNLKSVWYNIEYDTWTWYAKKDGYTDEQIEQNKAKFLELKKDVQTKIDLLLERVKNMIDSAEKGEKDYDYIITCHSVGSGFTLEEHLSHLKPSVVFRKVFEDDSERNYR